MAPGGRTQAEWFMEAARQATIGPMIVVSVTMFAVGGLARDAGFSMGIAIGSTLLIWAGPAQVLYFGAVSAQTAWPAIALLISLSSVRFVPMVVSMLPVIRTPRTRLATLILAAHCIAVTVWAEGMRRLPGVPKPARMSFFFGFATMIFIGSTLATAIGYLLIGELPKPLAAALLFITPIYFTATLTRGARQNIDKLALAFGFGLAPVTQMYGAAGFDLVILGLVAGTAAFFAARRIDRRGSLA